MRMVDSGPGLRAGAMVISRAAGILAGSPVANSFAAPLPPAYVNAMRTIGNLPSEKAAARFSDFLYVRGIENQFEEEDDGTFSLWIIDESQLTAAGELLASFRANPDAPTFSKETDAEKKRRAEEAASRAGKSSVLSAERLAYERSFQAMPYVTYLLMIISVAVAIYSQLGQDKGAIHGLFIADLKVEGEFVRWLPGLAEIRAGEIWRLITPIFIHFSLIHIAFNMMLLKDLGALVESRFGGLYLFGLVVVSAALSNVGQHFWGGPIFGGMSGIVYALFGFLWTRGKLDRSATWEINPTTVHWMIGWFVICLVGIIPYVANACHAIGLAVGMAWGWISVPARFSR